MIFLAASAGLYRTVKVSAAQKVAVHPGDNIQALVAKIPPGTTFRITPGVYRLQSIHPKDGDTFLGQPGAVLTGAIQLTSFKHKGTYWEAKVEVTQQGSYRGNCRPTHPACMLPQDLFFGNTPLERVRSVSDVASGKWYLDSDDGTAYVGSDPSGQSVTMSSQPAAFWGNASNVTIKGLTIRKYASIAGFGAINALASPTGPGNPGKNWVVDSDDLYLNHGMAIRVSGGMTVSNNKIHDNGQLGLGGGGDKILVENNQIYGNNYAGYAYGWEAGGAKFMFTTNLVVKNNVVYNNGGPGLWTDTDNTNTLYEGNHTSRNKVAGILHEISYQAVIRDNTIENDGYDGPGRTAPWYGGGIVISTSSGVDVYGNTVVDCMNGIVGLQAQRGSDAKTGEPYHLQNLSVHNNVITQNAGVAAGIVASAAFGGKPFQSWNNHFTGNTFHLADTDGKYFRWMHAFMTLRQWRAEKHKGAPSGATSPTSIP